MDTLVSPENQWLENEIPEGYLFGDMLIFGGRVIRFFLKVNQWSTSTPDFVGEVFVGGYVD